MSADETTPSAAPGHGGDRVPLERRLTVTPSSGMPAAAGEAPGQPSRTGAAGAVSKAVEAGGEAANAVNSVKRGVAIGTRLGGAHGAAVGAVAGGLKAVVQSKHRKKFLVALLALFIPNLLIAALLVLPLALAVGGSNTTQVDTLAMSRSRDTGAVTGQQATDYAEASARSGIHWSVLASLEAETTTGGDVAEGADSGVPTPNPNPDAILDVQIASWNALKSQRTANVIAGIEAIGDAGADVIGLQEITPDSKRNQLRSRLGNEWGMSQVDNAVLILWRRDRVDLVAQHSEKVFETVSVESGGIGGGSFGPKSLQWAEFKTKDTGAHFAVINNHLLPSIETKGKPDPSHPKRVAAAERQMAAALAAADKLQAAGLASFITGDHNIDAQRDAKVRSPKFPYVKYAQHGMYSNWRTLGYPSKGTHGGGRLIDYVFASNALGSPIKQTILPRYGSDHNAVLVQASNDPNAVKQGTSTGTDTGTSTSGNSDTPSLTALTSGTGPFHLDVDKFNELAKKYGTDELTQESATRRDDAGAALGKLFEAMLAETDPSLTSNDLTSGAETVETTEGTVLQLGSDDDSLAAQERVKTAFVKVFGQLPIEGAEGRAEPYFQIALMYALGNPPSVCTTGETTTASPSLATSATATPSSSASSSSTPTAETSTGTSATPSPTEHASPSASASEDDGSDTSAGDGGDSDDDSNTESGLTDADGNIPAGSLPTTLTATTSSGSKITLTAKQIQHAAEIIGYGEKLGLEPKYIQVALMTALQESKLQVYANSSVPESLNYPHEAVGSDHDSVNLFQQRPPAWGSVEQLMQVSFTIGMFYGGPTKPKTDGPPGLLDISGYQTMGLGQLAQKVQVSAHPSYYDQWEPVAATIMGQVAGIDVGSVGGTASTCASSSTSSAFLGECPQTTMKAETQGLTPDALLVTRCVAAAFPTIKDIFTYAGHQPTQAQAVDIMVPDWDTPAGQKLGHDISRWVQDHQAELGVQYVIYWGEIWNVERNGEGWRTYFDADSSDPSRAHHNHVHVSVYGDKGTGPTASSGSALTVADGQWANPSGDKSITCDMSCYGGHTGVDYPNKTGDPIYSAFTGTVIRSESLPASGGSCTTLPICGGTNHRSYGNFIVVQSAADPTLTAYYAHLSQRLVPVGTVVKAGQQIGKAGYEGNVIPVGPGGAHLHFEIRDDGKSVNPVPLLKAHGVG